MPVDQHVETIMRAPLQALDGIMRAAYAELAANRMTDTELQTVAETVEARRRALKQPVGGLSVPKVVVLVREDEKRQPAANVAARPLVHANTRIPPAGHSFAGERFARQLTLRIPRPASYDRAQSRERRRRLAASGPMPPVLAASFTCAELATLAIVADEVRAQGVCSVTAGELAGRAGASETSVRNAIRLARQLGLGIVAVDRRCPSAAWS